MPSLDPDAVVASSKPRRAPLPIAGAMVLGLIAGMLIVVLAGWGMLSRATGGAALSQLWSSMTGRTLSIDVSRPTVVEKIQRLQRLETVVYTMDKMVTGSKQNAVLPDFLAGDRLLMMVHGDVVAGIDFSALKAGDVQVDGKNVHLHLPASQIFRARLDSEKTRVYSRQTGLLVPTDPNLETQVRQEAERQIQDAALADGILKTSQVNAVSTITSLLQGLGFTKIDVD
jgi:hypothetical protein